MTDSTMIANLDNAPGAVAVYLAKHNQKVATAQAIVTANGVASKTVEQIATDLAANSKDERVLKIRERMAKDAASLVAHFDAEAVTLKNSAGEPDKIAESKALKDVDNVRSLLEEECVENGISLADVDHFLDVVVGNKNKRVIGGASGPKRDLGPVRIWAKENGFDDVKEKGRISADVVDAFDKVHAA
jgi:hypothetical protein